MELIQKQMINKTPLSLLWPASPATELFFANTTEKQTPMCALSVWTTKGNSNKNYKNWTLKSRLQRFKDGLSCFNQSGAPDCWSEREQHAFDCWEGCMTVPTEFEIRHRKKTKKVSLSADVEIRATAEILQSTEDILQNVYCKNGQRYLSLARW